MNPFPLLRAALRRHPLTATLFTGLIVCTVALSIAISAEERAIRQGSARAADKFDLLIGAPGSKTELLLASVFLKPTAVNLLSPATVRQILTDQDAVFAAPLAFGDSHGQSPVVGTTAQFVDYLSDGLEAGRLFTSVNEAVVGALVSVPVGGSIEIRHGHADALSDEEETHYDDHPDHVYDDHEPHDRDTAHSPDEFTNHTGDEHAHAGDHPDHADESYVLHDHGTAPPHHEAVDHAGDEHAHHDDHPDHADESYVLHDHGTAPPHHEAVDHAGDEHAHHDDHHGHIHDHPDVVVTGRMRPTGTPWDRAVIVPVEYIWRVHGLSEGHLSGSTHVGPPWAEAQLPGLPSLVMRPKSIAAAYGLRHRYRTADSMAFFPAETLVELYEVLGQAVQVMAGLNLMAQILVVVAVLGGLIAVLDLQRRRFAVLRALGAPARYVFLSVWLYVGVMILGGAVLGLPLGWLAADIASKWIAHQSGIAMTVTLGFPELKLAAILAVAGCLLALIPALKVYRQPVVEALQ